MNRDQFASAWVLIGGSILIGVWYWKLDPAAKLAKLGRSGGTTPADVPSFTTPPPGHDVAPAPSGQSVPLGQAPSDATRIVSAAVDLIFGRN